MAALQVHESRCSVCIVTPGARSPEIISHTHTHQSNQIHLLLFQFQFELVAITKSDTSEAGVAAGSARSQTVLSKKASDRNM